jgi:6,7-dimethyl-8-ribityllumazine synthase
MSQYSHSFNEFSVQAIGTLRVGIVASCYNGLLVDGLLDRVVGHLNNLGVEAGNIETHRVPGAFEIPYVVHRMAMLQEHDVIIALGVVVGGDTFHHELIGDKTADAFLDTAFELEIPVINGVMVTKDLSQAQARCTGSMDRGREFAEAALVMANYKRRFDACEEGPTLGFTH